MSTHKRGEIVTIFSDPITKETPEGRAKLFKNMKQFNSDGLELWEVIFLGESQIVLRWI